MSDERQSKKRKLELESESESEDSEYFENDYSEIKTTIVEHILDKLSKNQRLAFEKKVQAGVDESFELLEELLVDAFTGLITHKPTDNMWKLGLGPKDIKKYRRELKELRRQPKITVKKILDTKLSKTDKRKLLQYYDLLQSTDRYSPEYTAVEEEMNKMLKSGSNPKLVHQEQRLKKIINQQLPLKTRILTANMDDSRKAAIYEKYLQLEKNPDDSVTSAHLEEWIEEALKTPFAKVTDPFNVDKSGRELLKLKRGFEEHLSEMGPVLEPLLTIFNNRMYNKDSESTVIGLLGSPGTGKTNVGKVIADVWGLPFRQISLGGVLDSSILDGQHSGWVGSNPGQFAKALQEMGVLNGVLFLDEIDKLGETQHGLQVQYSLLHSLDPVQNSHYNDHYLGSKLPLDLSKCLIICAMNKVKGIDPALLNRMHIIKVPDYTRSQKSKIMLQHLFPNALKNAGLIDEIILSEDICDYIQQTVEKNIGKEGGVRGVKGCIRMIVDKLALLLRLRPKEVERLGLTFKIDISKPPIEITREIVDKLYPVGQDDRQENFMYL